MCIRALLWSGVSFGWHVTCANISSSVELAIVLGMVVVDHLEKVGIVARAEGLVQCAVECLA